jgi:hypothetical protein
MKEYDLGNEMALKTYYFIDSRYSKITFGCEVIPFLVSKWLSKTLKMETKSALGFLWKFVNIIITPKEEKATVAV